MIFLSKIRPHLDNTHRVDLNNKGLLTSLNPQVALLSQTRGKAPVGILCHRFPSPYPPFFLLLYLPLFYPGDRDQGEGIDNSNGTNILGKDKPADAFTGGAHSIPKPKFSY